MWHIGIVAILEFTKEDILRTAKSEASSVGIREKPKWEFHWKEYSRRAEKTTFPVVMDYPS